MSTQAWIITMVGLSFVLYIGLAIWSRVGSTRDFYVAGSSVHPVVNGMATAADWMSAASFISMAGLIAFLGYDGSVYLLGWTGGYVLLALLVAPYLKKLNLFTVPDFFGTRYYSSTARIVAVICLIFVSFTYIAGQMRGVGIVFSRFLEVDINNGVLIGMGIVFLYSVLGGMKGITYTQVAQYCVMIFAYTVPAAFISFALTDIPIPQIGMGAELNDGSGMSALQKLDSTLQALGMNAYTSGSRSTIDMFAITAALMVGTAGLPHVIVRFFTVSKASAARVSAGWALVFIAILYTTAPAVGVFSRSIFIDEVNQSAYQEAPAWFKNWEDIGLIGWVDKNSDGVMQYRKGSAFVGAPEFSGERGESGQRLLTNPPTESENEVYVDRDIMVLATPEMANLPGWLIALVAAGGLAAALSTAAGLLLVISSAISHDLLKQTFLPRISDKQELLFARLAAASALTIAGYLGINPPAFVAQVVAFAFGLAAASLFPAILLGVFASRTTREGAIAGMLAGLLFTGSYIAWFKFVSPELNSAEHWLLGISPEGIGLVGMMLNFCVALTVSRFTPAPPPEVLALSKLIRSAHN